MVKSEEEKADRVRSEEGDPVPGRQVEQHGAVHAARIDLIELRVTLGRLGHQPGTERQPFVAAHQSWRTGDQVRVRAGPEDLIQRAGRTPGDVQRHGNDQQHQQHSREPQQYRPPGQPAFGRLGDPAQPPPRGGPAADRRGHIRWRRPGERRVAGSRRSGQGRAGTRATANTDWPNGALCLDSNRRVRGMTLSSQKSRIPPLPGVIRSNRMPTNHAKSPGMLT